MAKTISSSAVQTSENEAQRRLVFADAALGAAGHEIDDPYLNGVGVQQARGQISGDEARELGRRYLLNR